MPLADPVARHRWLRTAQVLAAGAVLLTIPMQGVAGAWFPPPISISQYGLGPWGWIFSLWAISLAGSPLCAVRALPGPDRLARWLLGAGFAAAVLMATVRTQQGGAQQTWNARVHQVGASVALALVPLGMLAVMWRLGTRQRVIGVALTSAVAVSMALLLLAAVGYDTAGLGPARSWAFWQTVGVLACIAQVVTLAVGVGHRFRAAGFGGSDEGRVR